MSITFINCRLPVSTFEEWIWEQAQESFALVKTNLSPGPHSKIQEMKKKKNPGNGLAKSGVRGTTFPIIHGQADFLDSHTAYPELALLTSGSSPMMT